MTNVRVPPEAMRAAGAAEGRSVVVGKTTVGVAIGNRRPWGGWGGPKRGR